MKKQLSLVFSLLAALLIVIGCNNDDDTAPAANPIIGTWKLTEVYLNGQAVAATACELEENYIFGAEQYTHEMYGNSGARMLPNFRSSLGHDDSDDEDSDEHSSDNDDDSDEHSDDSDETTPTTPSTDNGSDEGSDEGSDDDSDDNGGSGTCVNTDRIIGYWTAQNSLYSFTADGVTTQTTITFEDGNNRMYYEVTTTVNGQLRTKRYIFQRQ